MLVTLRKYEISRSITDVSPTCTIVIIIDTRRCMQRGTGTVFHNKISKDIANIHGRRIRHLFRDLDFEGPRVFLGVFLHNEVIVI